MTSRPSGWTPEDERPLPETPFFRQLGEDLWEGYFTLVVWALLLWVLSLPSVLVDAFAPPFGLIMLTFTVVPALAGLMVASGKAAKGGFTRVGDAARGTFRLYRRSVALALPLMLLLAMVTFTSGVIEAHPERPEMVLAAALQIGLSLAVAILHIYLLPVLALYETSLKQTFQIAMVLLGKHLWQTLALLALALVLLMLPVIHFLFWMVVPGVWSVVVMNATWRLSKNLPIAKQG